MGLNSRGGGGSRATYLNIYQGNIVLEYNSKTDIESKLESLGIEVDTSLEASEKSKMDVVCVRQRTKGRYEGKDVFYYILRDVGGILTNIDLKIGRAHV